MNFLNDTLLKVMKLKYLSPSLACGPDSRGLVMLVKACSLLVNLVKEV